VVADGLEKPVVMLDALLLAFRRTVALGASFLPDLLTMELNVDIMKGKASRNRPYLGVGRQSLGRFVSYVLDHLHILIVRAESSPWCLNELLVESVLKS
jgi:hypothetical protein